LIVDARRIDGFLNVHLEINDVQDCLQNGRDNATSAWRAEKEDRLAVLGDDRWAHRTEGCLAWRDGIRVCLDKAVTVDQTWVWREIVHFVIHQHTRTRRNDPRSKPVIKRVRH